MSERVLVGRRGLRPRGRRIARLADHELAFDLAGIPLLEPAFASVRERSGAHVWGVLWTLDARDVRTLRRTESPRYHWSDVEVEVEGRRVAAKTLKNRTPTDGIVPSRRYRNILLDAAKSERLPAEWVAELEARPYVTNAVVGAVGATLVNLAWQVSKLRRWFGR